MAAPHEIEKWQSGITPEPYRSEYINNLLKSRVDFEALVYGEPIKLTEQEINERLHVDHMKKHR